MTNPNPNPVESAIIERERARLRAITFLNDNLYKIYKYSAPLSRLATLTRQALGCTNALIFIFNEADETLELQGASPEVKRTAYQGNHTPAISINLFNLPDESPLLRLIAGRYVTYDSTIESERLSVLDQRLGSHSYGIMPLLLDGKLQGALVLFNIDSTPLMPQQQDTLQSIATTIASALSQAMHMLNLKRRLESTNREMEIFSRIDEELADVIELDYVFRMTMDWALRFTNADAAALSLYNAENDTIRIMAQYGHRPDALPSNTNLQAHEGGISKRVARSGIAEIVPDVSLDKDYYAVANGTRTQMTVPIMREDRVIAVIALESKKLNGFTDENLAFVKRLTGRAGVAVDNARLFSETRIEREKLQYILRNIADIAILIGTDHRIMIMNYSALLALRLSVEDTYIDKVFADVVEHQALQQLYREAIEQNDTTSDEIELPDGRTYHVRISYYQGVGRFIVMQDITHFKETDKLKTELVATVSHDLKQPLAVMRGYLDLLRMTNEFDERSQRYVENLEYSFTNMRQLIDDLLDIAHIESGLNLDLGPVAIGNILRRCVSLNKPLANNKAQKLEIDIPETLPSIPGDEFRLQQVFINLISNAIKYTPPEGEIKVSCEVRQETLRILIADNGMGIGPEDQSQIFERFYRVRRPETDSIDGTGLGLAIVKSLVEAHRGKIDVESELGQGSTFRVVLPLR